MNRISFLLSIILGIGLAGCTGTLGTTTADSPSTQFDSEGNRIPTEAPPDSFSLTEIPIPDGAVVVLEDTIIVGGDDGWTGRVVMRTDLSTVQATRFFRAKMVDFGWLETSVIRSLRSAIAFSKDSRFALIRIEGVLRGSQIEIVIAPTLPSS